jgi:hypothetical protein
VSVGGTGVGVEVGSGSGVGVAVGRGVGVEVGAAGVAVGRGVGDGTGVEVAVCAWGASVAGPLLAGVSPQAIMVRKRTATRHTDNKVLFFIAAFSSSWIVMEVPAHPHGWRVCSRGWPGIRFSKAFPIVYSI